MNCPDIIEDGAALVPQLLSAAECLDLDAELDRHVISAQGDRELLRQPWCAALATRLQTRVSSLRGLRAVQCTYFEKSAGHNWLVAAHQDLSIPVAKKLDNPELQGWSIKSGQWFVRPPAALLGELLALRVHVDDCQAADGPLRILPKSHRQGIVASQALKALPAQSAYINCLARRGDAWLIKPLVVHASSKGTGHGRRRVLHFLFAPHTLPCGLTWG